MLLLKSSLLAGAFPLLTAAQYTLEDDYSISNFASMFDFYTGPDPTNGFVNYISQPDATSQQLLSTTSQSIFMRADSTNPATGRGRNAIRISSRKSYNHGLIILDAAHMPAGCGTWPAFWLLGPNWPASGEVDIIEGVNSQTSNSFAMHTSAGCRISQSSSFTGTVSTQNCDVHAPDQGTNVGCAIKTADPASYGSGFNAAGGGVYATLWTSTAVSIFFFSRSQIPADITSGQPDPSSWGRPQAQFSNDACDIDSHIRDQQIVFTNTFCGDWAGQVWSSDATCAPRGSTCVDFVRDNPGAFAEAYWEVRSLKVYQDASGGSGNVSTGGGGEPPAQQPPPTTLVTMVTPGVDEGSQTSAVVPVVPAPQPTQGEPQTVVEQPAPPPAAPPSQQGAQPTGNVVTQIEDGQLQVPAKPQGGGRGDGKGWSGWGGRGARGGRGGRLMRFMRRELWGV